jgi:DNA-binding winged helix-turn-helix (wHTH) protein
MASSVTAACRLCFDAFELDVRAGELKKRRVKLRLQGQPLQVLATFLNCAGDVVTRDELRNEIWPVDTFVDFDHSLHNAIARVREVLGDSVDTPRYIETLPRRGYRFIAPVRGVEIQPPGPTTQSGQSTEAPVRVRSSSMRRRATRSCNTMTGPAQFTIIEHWLQNSSSKQPSRTSRCAADTPCRVPSLKRSP